ncbi:MAG: ATP-binding cassette domain-containing protein [Deltaproteobacteria bacterium]|nr:MAG: ATP-binding cassette domain-containing protein [Deltaproteobacteria bacterium]
MEASTDAHGPPAIECTDLTKYYGDFVALGGVTFSVAPCRVAAFLGPNGAGKSTTMRILTGYLAPSAGTIRVLGLDPTKEEQRLALARRLGYLPENGPLYREMTPYESLQFFGEVRRMRPAEVGKAIERVVEACALGPVLHKPIYKLSKGYRQRVGMAQAILHDPDVLILDEPTSGLDPLQIREVRGLIRKLGEEKTILLSTHILQEVAAVADDVIVVHEGRVVFSGTRDAFARDGDLDRRFYELTAAQGAKEVA